MRILVLGDLNAINIPGLDSKSSLDKTTFVLKFNNNWFEFIKIATVFQSKSTFKVFLKTKINGIIAVYKQGQEQFLIDHLLLLQDPGIIWIRVLNWNFDLNDSLFNNG